MQASMEAWKHGTYLDGGGVSEKVRCNRRSRTQTASVHLVGGPKSDGMMHAVLDVQHGAQKPVMQAPSSLHERHAQPPVQSLPRHDRRGQLTGIPSQHTASALQQRDPARRLYCLRRFIHHHQIKRLQFAHQWVPSSRVGAQNHLHTHPHTRIQHTFIYEQLKFPSFLPTECRCIISAEKKLTSRD